MLKAFSGHSRNLSPVLPAVSQVKGELSVNQTHQANRAKGFDEITAPIVAGRVLFIIAAPSVGALNRSFPRWMACLSTSVRSGSLASTWSKLGNKFAACVSPCLEYLHRPTLTMYSNNRIICSRQERSYETADVTAPNHIPIKAEFVKGFVNYPSCVFAHPRFISRRSRAKRISWQRWHNKVKGQLAWFVLPPNEEAEFPPRKLISIPACP